MKMDSGARVQPLAAKRPIFIKGAPEGRDWLDSRQMSPQEKLADIISETLYACKVRFNAAHEGELWSWPYFS